MVNDIKMYRTAYYWLPVPWRPDWTVRQYEDDYSHQNMNFTTCNRSCIYREQLHLQCNLIAIAAYIHTKTPSRRLRVWQLSRQNSSYPKIVLGQLMAENFCPMGQKISAKNNPILLKNVLVLNTICAHFLVAIGSFQSRTLPISTLSLAATHVCNVNHLQLFTKTAL